MKKAVDGLRVGMKSKGLGFSFLFKRVLLSCVLVLSVCHLPLPASLFAASSDTISLSVTPVVTYGISLSSVNSSGYDFGTVDLNSVSISTSAVLVQNSGNVISRWQISAYTEGTEWNLGDSTGPTDAAVLKALFNSQGGPVPTISNFATVNGSTITSNGRIAAQNSLSTSSVVNAIPANGRRDLFFMLHTPVTSSTGGQQKFRVYVTAIPNY